MVKIQFIFRITLNLKTERERERQLNHNMILFQSLHTISNGKNSNA